MPCSSLVYLYWLQSILNRSGPASSRGLNVYGLATLEEGNSLSKTPSRYVQLTPCGDLSEWRARFGFDRAILASRDRRRLRLLFARFAEESGNADLVAALCSVRVSHRPSAKHGLGSLGLGRSCLTRIGRHITARVEVHLVGATGAGKRFRVARACGVNGFLCLLRSARPWPGQSPVFQDL